MGMELLKHLLLALVALAVLHGLPLAEPLWEPPLSFSPQTAAFAPHAPTFRRLALFSEPHGPAMSPPDIAVRPPLISPLLPVAPPKEKIHLSHPTISIGMPIPPPKKMKPRDLPITPAVTPTPQPLREPPLRSPSTKHPIEPMPPYPSRNKFGRPPVSVPPASKPGTVSPPPHPPKAHRNGNYRPDNAYPSNDNINSAPAHSPAPPTPVISFPPPPPNQVCGSFVCVEPFTNTLPGAPCGCVQPVQVGLRLNVALYAFFPLVTMLAEKIAASVFLKQNQVRIIGSDASNQQPEKTVVLIDLVPDGAVFDSTTALLIFNRFWNKNVELGREFGDYDVLFVRYPGLPLPPPTSDLDTADSIGSHSGNGNNGVTDKPLGVDANQIPLSRGLDTSVIAIVVLSASIAVILIFATAWLVIFWCRHLNMHSKPPPQPLLPSHVRKSDGSNPGSGLKSFASSIAANIGSGKVFSYAELQKATSNFDASKIVGEGGFGCVYSGILENGMHVAVKVLKRDDHHGDQEFMAEVEMLSRLHHRNLVKLIGICTEAHNRCLIYELVPNGSVESHLHGKDKEWSPLDWVTRLKIAIGAARGLAYLHEDSNPRVIHRDFKSSNILLEDDFTPKVSDFGLARTGRVEQNGHISTRVMGTFGYVAPEYAMTGHLLVKSDVYSYGVVLLELLTGRKPVDMSQPHGEENLVSWARPLLASREGVESVLDESLRPVISYDSAEKVAEIASLCVQPEVSLRPYMGEVVQALKLVYEQCGGLVLDVNNGHTGSSSQFSLPLNSDYPDHNPNSEFDMDEEIGISAS